MLRVTGFILSIFLSFLPSVSYSQQMDLTLSSKESKTIANNYVWTISATCTIHSTEDDKVILVSAINSDSEVNGKKLSEGNKTSITIKNNDNIKVSAKPGAKVIILNTSQGVIKASCQA